MDNEAFIAMFNMYNYMSGVITINENKMKGFSDLFEPYYEKELPINRFNKMPTFTFKQAEAVYTMYFHYFALIDRDCFHRLRVRMVAESYRRGLRVKPIRLRYNISLDSASDIIISWIEQ